MEASGRPQFLPATYSAPVQRSGLHLSACQKESYGHLLPLLASPKITGILIRSKLTVTINKGTYQDTLACMQLYHASLARLISRSPSPPTQSVGYDTEDRSQLYGRY